MNLFCAIWWTFLFCIGFYEAITNTPPNTVIYLCAVLLAALYFWEKHFREED